MSHQTTSPALIFPGQAARILVQLPKVHAKFDERFLQELLATNPELLPAVAIRDDVGRLLCVGREVGVQSGSIDNLYLSTTGYPVLVETKLWRNPQARREVLSQTLDYIKDLTKLDFAWFEEKWQKHSAGTPHQGVSLIGRISELAEEEIDESEFIDRVNHALVGGNIISMIVGDGIESRLQELVAHLCKDSAHLRYALALCELSFFKLGPADSDGMIVVPRIVGNVEPVQRAHVRIDLADALAQKLTITHVEAQSQLTTGPARVSLSEDDFLRSVETSAGAALRAEIEKAYKDLVDSFKLEASFKSASLMLKIPHPEGERLGASVFAFEKDGRVYNTRHMRGQLERWEILKPEVIAQLTSEYWDALNRINPHFPRDGVNHLASKKYIPFSEISLQWKEIREAIGAVTKKISTLVGVSEEAD